MTIKAKPRVCIVTQYFYPSTQATSQLATDIAHELQKDAYYVEVLTSSSGHRLLNQIPVIRTHASSNPKNNILGKISSGISFVFHAVTHVLSQPSNNIMYLVFSNPPFICPVFGLLNLLKRTKYVFVYQDLFPQSAVVSGILPPAGLATLSWQILMNFGCTRASNIIVLNNAMKTRLLKSVHLLSSNVSVIHNWAVSLDKTTESNRDFRAEWNVNSEIVLLYSGNLGRLHDIITFLESARLLVDKPFKFIFSGHGPKVSQVKRYVNEYRLTNVIVQEAVPIEDLNDLLSASDIALMSTVPGAESLIAPSKLYGILASGKPVLYVGQPTSEISLLINHFRCGWTFANGESVPVSNELASLLDNSSMLKSYSLASYSTYTALFGLEKAAIQYKQILSTARTSS